MLLGVVVSSRTLADRTVTILAQNNDRYVFPVELDLDRDNYFTEDADRSVRNVYFLHR
jgi:hypothetical protein